MTGEDVNEFVGDYRGTNKIADLAVQVRNGRGTLDTKLVVEIGFSEDYDNLVKDVTIWLEGMRSVSLCALVSFVEEPRYSCPVDYANLDEQEFKALAFPEPDIRAEDFELEGPFGPVVYRGQKWVGAISGAFEWWKRDRSGRAKKYGERRDLYTAGTINFKRSHSQTQSQVMTTYFQSIVTSSETFSR